MQRSCGPPANWIARQRPQPADHDRYAAKKDSRLIRPSSLFVDRGEQNPTDTVFQRVGTHYARIVS